MAVVRVKRHCQDEPIDTLILACKKRKTNEDHLTSVFNFTTTVTVQDEDVSQQISKAFKSFNDVKQNFKTHKIENITDRLRAKNKLFSQNSRLKVVNCFRALNEDDSLESSEEPSACKKNFTVVDIESLSPTAEDVKTSTDEDHTKQTSEYVYDIYYAPDFEMDEHMFDNPISCHALNDLVFEDCSNETYDVEEDSDDSNDENNWRNDYPDEDPDSIGEDDMRLVCGMGGLNISETNSLSSDAGEEELVYGVEDPDYGAGVNPSDVDYFGYDYAAFKKRVLNPDDSDQSANSDFCYGDSDLESDRS